MAIQSGGIIKSIQKLSGNLASQAYPLGSTVLTVSMPNFQVTDPSNAFVENVWWRLLSGALPVSGLVQVFADVTGPNQITVVVDTPVAFTAGLQVGGRVVEYG